MTVKDIVLYYLKSNGFDGLRSEDVTCGCGVDDLYPCACDCLLDCMPAYRVGVGSVRCKDIIADGDGRCKGDRFDPECKCYV